MGSALDATLEAAPDASDDTDAPRVIGSAPARWLAYVLFEPGSHRAELTRIEGGAPTPGTPLAPMLKPAGDDRLRWSPDGSRLSYLADPSGTGSYDAFVVEVGADGPGDPMRAAGSLSGPLDIYRVQWSPDASKIAFMVGNSAPASIYLSSLDGNAPLLVSSDSAADQNWGFSSDGRFLAYAETTSIRTLDLESGLTTLVDDFGSTPAGHYAWLGDSSLLVFDRLVPTDPDYASVFVFDVGALQPASPKKLDGMDGIVKGAWRCAPKGTSVAFSKGASGGGFALQVVDAVAAGPSKPASGGEAVLLWRWSPDGTSLFFQEALTDRLYVSNAQADNIAPQLLSADHLVLSDGSLPEEPKWWPDSAHVQFLVDSSEPAFVRSLAVADVNASPPFEPALLAPEHPYAHTISPNGRWVEFSGSQGKRAIDLWVASAAPVSLNATFPTTSAGVWAPDSSMIVYWASSGQSWSLLVNDTSNHEPTQPSVITTHMVEDVHWQP